MTNTSKLNINMVTSHKNNLETLIYITQNNLKTHLMIAANNCSDTRQVFYNSIN